VINFPTIVIRRSDLRVRAFEERECSLLPIEIAIDPKTFHAQTALVCRAVDAETRSWDKDEKRRRRRRKRMCIPVSLESLGFFSSGTIATKKRVSSRDGIARRQRWIITTSICFQLPRSVSLVARTCRPFPPRTFASALLLNRLQCDSGTDRSGRTIHRSRMEDKKRSGFIDQDDGSK